jgi:hypothetical protein
MLMQAILRSLNPGPDSTKADEDILAALDRELEEFRKDVLNGRA